MGFFGIERTHAVCRDNMLRSSLIAEDVTMTTTRRTYCPLLARTVTLTVQRLPGVLSGLGSASTWTQREVDCDQWMECPSGGSDDCLRRIAERKYNGE